MRVTAEDYTWINTSAIAEAGCVTLVPAADRKALLAAFGAREESAQPVGSGDQLAMGAGGAGPIYVTEVGDALLVLENNGFQGSRSEVLRPASKASGSHVAASYFWNVNALTSFAAAWRGRSLFALELLGAEAEDLDGVPKSLRPLVLAGGAEDGDLIGAGLALVAGMVEVGFTEEVLAGGVVYDVEPVPADLLTYLPGGQDIHDLPGAVRAVSLLTPDRQRSLAGWVAVAAVVESGVGDEVAIARVLAQLGPDGPPTAPAALDALARAAEKKYDSFCELETQLEWGGLRDAPKHPFHEETTMGIWGEERAISHLEGSYLAQRRWAVEAVRYLTHTDPFSAVVGCLRAARIVFERGRTTRGWTFIEDDSGREREGVEPNPRHQAFIRAASGLLAALAEDGSVDDAVIRANLELPEPLTDDQRKAAIRADARAALAGAFGTWQVAGVEGDDQGEELVVLVAETDVDEE